MKPRIAVAGALLALAGLALPPSAGAAVPPPTPEQAQAAAAKKAAADAQAAKDKQALGEAMDAIAQRWRQRAAAQGWKTNAPVAVAPVALSAKPATPGPGGPTVPGTRGPAGQQGGQLQPTPAKGPIKSAKLGTAPLSEDVKKRPTPTLRGGPPAHVREDPSQPLRGKEK